MISIFHGKNYSTTSVGGGTLVYQAGYYPRKRTFKTHPKHVFFRNESRPYKYVFLHALFLICLPCPFQNLSIWPKSHPFIFRYENRPYKYVFLQAFFFFLFCFVLFCFLICPPCPFQNLSIWPKIHPFPQILHVFCTPKRCTRVHCLVLKNNPNYIFSRMISNFKYKCPPPGLRK